MVDQPVSRIVLLARFVRADTMGASITMVLLGAATADRHLSLASIPALVAIAISFHLFAYLLNDVIDLPIDRTDPRRAGTPLVLGLARPAWAIAVALLQVPLLTGLVFGLDGDGPALTSLAILLLAVTIYDIWGKRFPVPPITDLTQGVAWAALGWLGAEIVGGSTRWTVLLAAYFLIFIMLANGVHGSIRDLTNDRQHGARTTATWFGAEAEEPGGAVPLGTAYLWYAFALQAITITLPFVPIVFGWIVLNEGWNALLMAVFCSLSTGYLVVAARADSRRSQLVHGARHLILVLCPLFVLLARRLPPWAAVAVIVCYVAPFAAYRWVFRPSATPVAHWAVQPTRQVSQ